MLGHCNSILTQSIRDHPLKQKLLQGFFGLAHLSRWAYCSIQLSCLPYYIYPWKTSAAILFTSRLLIKASFLYNPNSQFSLYSSQVLCGKCRITFQTYSDHHTKICFILKLKINLQEISKEAKLGPMSCFVPALFIAQAIWKATKKKKKKSRVHWHSISNSTVMEHKTKPGRKRNVTVVHWNNSK